MLDPYFFRCPPELNLNLKAPDLTYRITGYSQVGQFTLVSWQFGSSEEYFQGEALYKDKDLLTCGGGILPLPGDFATNDSYQNLMPWDRLSPTLWELGVNQNIAKQLRSPNNTRIFSS